MLRIVKLSGVVVIGLVAAGCLQKEVTHTLYLSPEGAVRWTIDESAVHSDEADEGKRFAEEQAYIGPALVGTHAAALGLQALGPDGLVRTHVLRDERPFHVVTDARFVRIDRALDRMFKECGVKAAAALTQDGDRTTLRIRFDFRQEIPERDGPVLAMLKDVDDLRFVLTDGSFVAGGGFDVPDRKRAVVSPEWIAAAEKVFEARKEIELVLAWER